MKKSDLLSFEVFREKRGGFLISSVRIRGTSDSLHGISILQLSDFHFGPATSADHLKSAVAVANSLDPTYAVLTGDFIQLSHIGLRHFLAPRFGVKLAGIRQLRRLVRAAAKELGEILAKLKVEREIFGVYGNHDHHEGLGSIRRQLEPYLSWINNETLLLPNGLGLSGVDDYKNGKPDLEKVVRDLKKEAVFQMLLSHNPDIVLDKDSQLLGKFDLIACGHTHGGQIKLPYFPPPISRTKQRDHIAGLSYARPCNNSGEKAIYVNQGIGFGGIGLRLFCPPEITKYTFL